MAYWQRIDSPPAMASRWRRTRLCELRIGECTELVALRDISGRGVLVELAAPPLVGTMVELRHPDAGSIHCRVSEIGEGRARLTFDSREAGVGFALSAIAADMTRG